MQTIKTFLFLCLIIPGLNSCQMKYTEGFDTYFWTSTPGGNVYLYVNGENKGKLPYISTGADCDKEESKRLATMIYLPSDTYKVEVRDEQQQVLYTEKFTALKEGKNIRIGTSTADKNGGSRNAFKDRCLMHELFYNE